MNYIVSFSIVAAMLLVVALSIYATLAAVHYAKNRQALASWRQRKRARILRIGQVVLDPPTALLIGWEWDLDQALPTQRHPETQEMAVAGYTIGEFIEIQHRAAEWTDVET